MVAVAEYPAFVKQNCPAVADQFPDSWREFSSDQKVFAMRLSGVKVVRRLLCVAPTVVN
jgi:hypothetical protein